VKKTADEKRWAILPPPSTVSAVAGRFAVQMEPARRRPARRTVSGEVRIDEVEADDSEADDREAEAKDSSVNELEPSDSERVTEVPPDSRQRFSDPSLETIPAPALEQED
jgi:hypothetical protein